MTVHGVGPYAVGQGDERLILLQVFMSVIAGSGLLLGATVSDRDASHARGAHFRSIVSGNCAYQPNQKAR